MRVINYSEARNNLANLLDQVADDRDVTVIARRGDREGDRAVVLMSLADYNSIQETAFLLRGANRERLLSAVADDKAGRTRVRKLSHAKGD